MGPKYFTSVKNDLDLINIALGELVLCSTDLHNLDKIEPILEMILFSFYN